MPAASSSRSTNSHVVVVGGGLAGLSTAFAAHRGGAFVTLVEKETLGGNSAKATSGANAVNTSFQDAREDIKDSIELFMNDTHKSGHGKCDHALVHILAAQSGAAVDALRTEHSLTLSDIEQLGGHSAKRTHRFPPKDGRVAPVGWTVINQLKQDFKKLVDAGSAQLMEHTALVDFELASLKDEKSPRYVSKLLLQTAGTQELVELRDFTAVVFAAGGYAADSSEGSLLAKFRPDLIGFPTTNGPFARGETTVLGMKHGLKVVDIEEVQLHPTGFVHPDAPLDERKFLCPEVMRGVGAILVDSTGSRFFDELRPRDKVSSAIREHGSSSQGWQLPEGSSDDKQRIAMLVMTEAMAERFGIAAFNFYKAKGFFFDISNGAALAAKAPTVDMGRLEQTLRRYDEAAEGKADDEFGKTVFPMPFGDLSATTLYGAFITPSLHFSMGGLAITADARAVDTLRGDAPVLNLFVAGENAGGIHGGNRLGGNGCLESMVFGRLAGRMGAKITQSSLKPDSLTPITQIASEILAVSAGDDGFVTLRLGADSPTHSWPEHVHRLDLPANYSLTKESIQRVAAHPGYADLTLKLADESIRTLLHPGAPFVAQFSHQ